MGPHDRAIPDDWQGEVREATAAMDKLVAEHGGFEGEDAWRVVRRELSGALRWAHRMMQLERRIGLVREAIDGEQDGKLVEVVTADEAKTVHDTLTYLPALAVVVEGRLPGYSVNISSCGAGVSLKDYVQGPRDEAERVAAVLNEAIQGHGDASKAWVRVDIENAREFITAASDLVRLSEVPEIQQLAAELQPVIEEAEERA